MTKSTFIAFVAGLLFGIGLMLSGMSNPHKVLSFLDISRDWDASLMLVMVGAITVAFFAFRATQGWTHSTLGYSIQLPDTRLIDRKLVLGAMLFGAGWGLAGFCPGPALVALLFGSLKPWIFVASMLVGMWLHQRLAGKR